MTLQPPLETPVPSGPDLTGWAGVPGLRINPFSLVLRRPHSPRPTIKLLGVLRGAGQLLAPGGAIEAQYEIDAFSAGAVRTATGGLTGDFRAWPDLAGVTESTGLAGQLRLAGGDVLNLSIVGGEPGLLEVDLACNALLLKLIAQCQPA